MGHKPCLHKPAKIATTISPCGKMDTVTAVWYVFGYLWSESENAHFVAWADSPRSWGHLRARTLSHSNWLFFPNGSKARMKKFHWASYTYQAERLNMEWTRRRRTWQCPFSKSSTKIKSKSHVQYVPPCHKADVVLYALGCNWSCLRSGLDWDRWCGVEQVPVFSRNVLSFPNTYHEGCRTTVSNQNSY